MARRKGPYPNSQNAIFMGAHHHLFGFIHSPRTGGGQWYHREEFATIIPERQIELLKEINKIQFYSEFRAPLRLLVYAAYKVKLPFTIRAWINDGTPYIEFRFQYRGFPDNVSMKELNFIDSDTSYSEDIDKFFLLILMDRRMRRQDEAVVQAAELAEFNHSNLTAYSREYTNTENATEYNIVYRCLQCLESKHPEAPNILTHNYNSRCLNCYKPVADQLDYCISCLQSRFGPYCYDCGKLQ